MRDSLTMQVRGMVEDDLRFAMDRVAEAGWNQTAEDWRSFLRLQRCGCFLAERTGIPAGTAVVCRFGSGAAWLGMVLVAESQRREGVGRALMQAVDRYVSRCGVGSVALDATEVGSGLYEEFGFEPAGIVERYWSEQVDVENVAKLKRGCSRRLRLNDNAENSGLLAEVISLDSFHFGADRSAMMRELAIRPGSHVMVASSDQRIEGYIFDRGGRLATQIGPWWSQGTEAAEMLLCACLKAVAEKNRRVVVDVPQNNREARKMVGDAGLVLQRSFLRMRREDNGCGLDFEPEVYGISGPERG